MLKQKKLLQKIASDYLREKVSSVGHGLAATELVLEPVDWNVDHSNMDAVVDYYYTLLDLKAELLRQDLTGNEIYDAVIEKTGLLKDSVDTYVQSIYDETSATYRFFRMVSRQRLKSLKSLEHILIKRLAICLTLTMEAIRCPTLSMVGSRIVVSLTS